MDEPRRFRKRPVEVDAIQWTGDNYFEVSAFVKDTAGGTSWYVQTDRDDIIIWIEKSQGDGRVRPGDWVIAERDGVGVYPCTADQFAEIYEPVE